MNLIFLLSLIFSSSISFGEYAPSRNLAVLSPMGPTIRVRIAKNLMNATIGGVDLDRKIYPTKGQKKFFGSRQIQFRCEGKANQAKNQGAPILLASLKSSTGSLDFAWQKFNGEIHVLADPEKGGCDIVNETSMEEYLSTLLSKEMNASWPIEVLKAQAVAARTYALYKIETNLGLRAYGKNGLFDLESSEKDQVSGSSSDATISTIQATAETRGEVLLSKTDKLTPIFFHAKCGGKTLLPDQVWDNHVEGYQTVICPYCQKLGPGPWQLNLQKNRLQKFIAWYAEKNNLLSLQKLMKKNEFNWFFAPDRSSNNNLKLYIGDQAFVLNKTWPRRYFGRVEVPSNNFTLYKIGPNYVLMGEGLGHGVGLCQLGALELAKRGLNYKQILSYYFPGHHLDKAY